MIATLAAPFGLVSYCFGGGRRAGKGGGLGVRSGRQLEKEKKTETETDK